MKKEIQKIDNNLKDQISTLPALSAESLQRMQEGLYSGKPLIGKGGIMSDLLKSLLELSLQGEMDSYLEDNTLEQGSNRRNGLSSKRIKSSVGDFDLNTPRDRNGGFEPSLVKKRQTTLNEELDHKILSLYALGNSYNDISAHLEDIYGVHISNGKISSITDRLIPQLNEWRNRPLQRQYSILFLDAMFFKTKQDNKIATKAVYNIMGINMFGHKEILGFYSCESEGSHFWLGVLNDLKARGLEDILICCIDGLKGFPEAINTAFPKTEIQLCIVHQIRNSIKCVASRDAKSFMKDLKLVYQAETKDFAEHNLLSLEEKWGKKYPMVLRSWNENWDHLSAYFKYSAEVRKLIYTTNPIEGFHRQVRKYTKTKGAFTSDNALFKLMFCAINKITEKWHMPIPNWAMTISQLDIFFPDRVLFGERDAS